VGFGVTKDDRESHRWLEQSHREHRELEAEINLARRRISDIPQNQLRNLCRRGYITSLGLAEHYRSRQEIERVELEYRREIADLLDVMGDSHPTTLNLKSTLSGSYPDKVNGARLKSY
jgi:hypothetical protein